MFVAAEDLFWCKPYFMLGRRRDGIGKFIKLGGGSFCTFFFDRQVEYLIHIDAEIFLGVCIL